MAYQEPEFRGDAVFKVNCTGDCVVGDEVCFERATFSGSYRRARFEGFEKVVGKIIADSYGRTKQQHTFTLELQNGSKTTIKGRNLYVNGVWRKVWADESEREEAANEKHARGEVARAARDARKSEQLAEEEY